MRATMLLLILMLTSTPVAFAQTGKHVAVGAGFVINDYTDRDFSQSNPSPAFQYRIKLKPETKHGWNWTLTGAFDWFRPDLDQDIAGQSTRIGELRARPVMAGIEREYTEGRVSLGISIVAGPSFNSFSVDDAARAAYRTRLRSDLNDVSVKTSLAVRPGVGIWYDLSRWLAVGASIDYMVNRLTAETTVGNVESSTKWKTDHLGFHFGVVVGVF